MGAAWERHGMCELALRAIVGYYTAGCYISLYVLILMATIEIEHGIFLIGYRLNV
jgi:hypothetical protein